jgi:DMSO reductase anchor subunit
MNPAPSVILFTVAAGAGYGLLAVAGIAAALGLFAAHAALGIAAVSLALALATLGLLSSTLHLGRPERAWRAVSQWRTSWLSREGVAALATYVPAGLLWLALVLGLSGTGVAFLGLLSTAGAVATLWCTGKLYAVLKPIREWHTPWTVWVFLALAASSGLLLWHALAAALAPALSPNLGAALALFAIAGATLAKRAWFGWLAAAPPAATRESAVGLAGRGTIRPLDPPHTGTNYLLDEMGFRIGRKHRAKLTQAMWWLGFAIPALLVALSPLLMPAPLAILAALLALAGTAIERWLFFATATHTVMLYYR